MVIIPIKLTAVSVFRQTNKQIIKNRMRSSASATLQMGSSRLLHDIEDMDDDSSLEVPLDVRVRNALANRMDQHLHYLNDDHPFDEDDKDLSAESDSSSNHSFVLVGGESSLTSKGANKENSHSQTTRRPTKPNQKNATSIPNGNAPKSLQPHAKIFPKPPPAMKSQKNGDGGGSSSLYCSRILQPRDDGETRIVYTCDCCQPGNSAQHMESTATTVSRSNGDKGLPVALVVDIDDSDDENNNDDEVVASTVVVPDCSPTSAAFSSTKRGHNTHQNRNYDSSDSTESESEVNKTSKQNQTTAATKKPKKKSVAPPKTRRQQQQQQQKFVDLMDSSSSSDSDDSFHDMVRKVTSRTSTMDDKSQASKPILKLNKVNGTKSSGGNPTRTITQRTKTPPSEEVNSHDETNSRSKAASKMTPATAKRRQPLRIDSSSSEEDFQWDGDDENDNDKGTHSEEEDLVKLMGRVDIQGDKNTNASKINGQERPARKTRRPRNAARRLDELTFSDDSDHDSFVVPDDDETDDDKYESSFIEISSGDDDEDDGGDDYSDNDEEEEDGSFVSVGSPISKPKQPAKKPKAPETLPATPRKPSATATTKRAKQKTKSAPSPKNKLSRKEFQQKRTALGQETFQRFNRAAFDGKLASVDLVWSNKLNKTAGITRMATITRGKTVVRREASIELATKVIDDMDRLEATLLHEMCHAADWMIDNNPKPGHGTGFKKWANIAMKQVSLPSFDLHVLVVLCACVFCVMLKTVICMILFPQVPGVIVTTKHTYEIAYKYAWVRIHHHHTASVRDSAPLVSHTVRIAFLIFCPP